MCSLCDLDEDVLTLIASSLSPPDVFALVTSSKRAFWSEQAPGRVQRELVLRKALSAKLSSIRKQVSEEMTEFKKAKVKVEAATAEVEVPIERLRQLVEEEVEVVAEWEVEVAEARAKASQQMAVADAAAAEAEARRSKLAQLLAKVDEAEAEYAELGGDEAAENVLAENPPLAVTLVQAALRRHLDALLQDLTLRTKDCLPWTLQDLFPEEEREKDFDASGRPQVLLSGSLAVQSALGIHPGDEAWKRCDVDIFCTWEAAPAVRRRLIERCKLICSGVVGLCVTLN